ncbi:amidohydrolase, partial [Streptomyces sp. SID11233]|nr:amidohydrolase [Streptomyces sp. SID11233]
MSTRPWSRRQVLNTAAGGGAVLGASALLGTGTAEAHGRTPAHGGHGRREKIIAIEEAVILPGLITQGTALNGAIPFKPEVTADWFK